MRLRWRRRGADDAAAELEPRPGMDEALAAERAAHEAVGEAKSRAGQVAAVVEMLGSLRRENHISDRLAQAMRDGYRGGDHAGG